MVAGLAHMALVHHDELVGALDGGESVGDDDRGAPFHHARERVAHPQLGFGVYAGGGFVEHQDFRIVGQRPRKRNKLLLSGA